MTDDGDLSCPGSAWSGRGRCRRFSGLCCSGGRRLDIGSWLPKDSRAGEYHRVDAFLSSDGDLCGLAVASPLLSRRNCRAAVCA